MSFTIGQSVEIATANGWIPATVRKVTAGAIFTDSRGGFGYSHPYQVRAITRAVYVSRARQCQREALRAKRRRDMPRAIARALQECAADIELTRFTSSPFAGVEIPLS